MNNSANSSNRGFWCIGMGSHRRRSHARAAPCSAPATPARARHPARASPPPARPSYVLEVRLGRPRLWSQLLTVTLSCMNSPVQMSTPMVMSTVPPRPITIG